MSKYNISCTIQNIQHIVIFGLLEIFLLLEVKTKTKMLHKTYREKPAPSTTVQSTKILFQEKSAKIN